MDDAGPTWRGRLAETCSIPGSWPAVPLHMRGMWEYFMIQLPKPTREKDEKYLKWIRAKHCVLRDYWPHRCWYALGLGEAHHVSPRNGTNSAALKASDDRRAVPVCSVAHRYCEQHPKELLEFLNEKISGYRAEYQGFLPPPEPSKPPEA